MADPKPIKLRNGATNNPRRIAGVDGRTSNARRFADILTQLSVEYLDVDPVALREIAGLKLTAEICQAAAIDGSDRQARSDLVRVSNLIARREKELRATLAKSTAAAPAPSVRDLLAEHEANRADR
jgi:hypothetical protein